jgi:SAM-dependent methyltransferase
LQRYLRGFGVDVARLLTGRRDSELPPARSQRVGKGDFREMGEWLAQFLIEHGLEPRHNVLDIGCGIGRIAIPLTRYITSEGSYDGFDLDERAIKWCRRRITPKHPNFRFVHANVLNPHYNESGVPAAQYRFPYGEGRFDFAWATSVIPHLDASGAANYIRETRKTLRPGGRFVFTCFISDGSDDVFTVDRGDHRLREGLDAGDGMAFKPETLSQILSPDQWSEVRIERGTWRDGPFEFAVKKQDVVVAVS